MKRSLSLLLVPIVLAEYITLDGSNNNRANSRWSVALGPFRPRASYNFLDGIGSVDPSLPNPRNVSNQLFGVGPFRFNEFKVSALAASWGKCKLRRDRCSAERERQVR